MYPPSLGKKLTPTPFQRLALPLLWEQNGTNKWADAFHAQICNVGKVNNLHTTIIFCGILIFLLHTNICKLLKLLDIGHCMEYACHKKQVFVALRKFDTNNLIEYVFPFFKLKLDCEMKLTTVYE